MCDKRQEDDGEKGARYVCLSVCLWSEPVSDGNVGIISGEMSKPGARRDIDARREILSRCQMVSEAIQQRSKAQRNATGDDLKVRQSREEDNINYGGVSEKRNLHIGLDFYSVHYPGSIYITGPGPEIDARVFFCPKTIILGATCHHLVCEALLYRSNARSRLSECFTIGLGYPFFLAISAAPRSYGS